MGCGNVRVGKRRVGAIWVAEVEGVQDGHVVLLLRRGLGYVGLGRIDRVPGVNAVSQRIKLSSVWYTYSLDDCAVVVKSEITCRPAHINS